MLEHRPISTGAQRGFNVEPTVVGRSAGIDTLSCLYQVDYHSLSKMGASLSAKFLLQATLGDCCVYFLSQAHAAWTRQLLSRNALSKLSMETLSVSSSMSVHSSKSLPT